MTAVARWWPQLLIHAVHPSWMSTRMRGADALDDLRLGHDTRT